MSTAGTTKARSTEWAATDEARAGSRRWWPRKDLPMVRRTLIHIFTATRSGEEAAACLDLLLRDELRPATRSLDPTRTGQTSVETEVDPPERTKVSADRFDALLNVVTCGAYTNQEGALALLLCRVPLTPGTSDDPTPHSHGLGVWVLKTSDLPKFEDAEAFANACARRFKNSVPHPRGRPFVLLHGELHPWQTLDMPYRRLA